MNKITKPNDIRIGDYIMLRNGDKLIYTQQSFKDLSENYDNNVMHLGQFDDYFNFIGEDSKNDIVRVWRVTPRINVKKRFLGAEEIETIIEKIWDRADAPRIKEMTIEEISEALGYDVKVVKKRG